MAIAAAPARSRNAAGLLEFLRFFATGAVAGVANLTARFVLNLVMPFELAVVLAYLIGMAIAFWLFQRVIFRDPATPLKRRLIRFTQVNLLGLVLAESISWALARIVLPAVGWTFRPLDVAHVVGVGVPGFTSYFLHKHYTFR